MKKKILLCVPNIAFNGGAEKVALSLAHRLHPKYDVSILSAFSTPAQENELTSAITVIHLGMKQPSGRLEKLKQLLIFNGIIKSKSKGFDILIGNNFFRYFFIPTANRDQKIYELHHLCYEEEKLSNLQIHARNIRYRMLDGIISLTGRDTKLFQRDGIQATHIPNFVDLPEITLFNRTSRKVVAGGRLTAQKNFADLVKAWSLLPQHLGDWSLHIYGDGPLRNELQGQINSLNLEKRIVLEGHVSSSHEIFCDAAFLVMTSIYEGFPMILLEALSHGVPIISYDCNSGPSDIILPERNGYLVPPGDVENLSNIISLLMESENKRVSLSEGAILTSRKFSWNKIESLWEDLLKKD